MSMSPLCFFSLSLFLHLIGGFVFVSCQFASPPAFQGDAPWSPRTRMAFAAADDGRLWVAGGFHSESESTFNDVWLFDPSINSPTGEWTLKCANGDPSSFSADNEPVMAYRAGRLFLTTVFGAGFISDDFGATWTQAFASGIRYSPRVGPSIIWNNNAIVLLGGHNHDFQPLANPVYFSTVMGASFFEQQVSNPSVLERWFASAIYLPDADKICIAGGQTTTGKRNDVWCSSGQFGGGLWVERTGNAPWEARSHHQSFFFDFKWFIMGGEGNDGYLADIWSTSTLNAGASWTQIAATTAFQARRYFGITVLNNYLYLVGGETSQSPSNEVFRAELQSAMQTNPPPPQTTTTRDPKSTIQGDPQFIGFLSQSYQLHGIEGTIYSILSIPFLSLNTKFQFFNDHSGSRNINIMRKKLLNEKEKESDHELLSSSYPLTTSYTHPGNYLSNAAIKIHSSISTNNQRAFCAAIVNSNNNNNNNSNNNNNKGANSNLDDGIKLFIEAGKYEEGFAVTLNGKIIHPSENAYSIINNNNDNHNHTSSSSVPSFTVSYPNRRQLSLSFDSLFSIEFRNADQFLNIHSAAVDKQSILKLINKCKGMIKNDNISNSNDNDEKELLQSFIDGLLGRSLWSPSMNHLPIDDFVEDSPFHTESLFNKFAN